MALIRYLLKIKAQRLNRPLHREGVFLPLDFESTKAGRPAPAAHRMPIAEAQMSLHIKDLNSRNLKSITYTILN